MRNPLMKRKALEQITANLLADKAPSTRRKYRQRIQHFARWVDAEDARLSKQTLGRYRDHLAFEGKAPSTINGYLVAVRQMILEAAEAGLLDRERANYIADIEGVDQRGERIGNWLSFEDAQRLLRAPNTTTLKGIRDRAILALMLWCGLRRSEVVSLTAGHLEQREQYSIIANLVGKHSRVRSIKIPAPAMRAVEAWLDASGRELEDESPLFVSLRKGGKLNGCEPMSPQAIYNLVCKHAEAIGFPDVRPHDLRRTFTKLSREGGASLEQISLTLGHSSIETTRGYLRTAPDFENSAPDAVGLELQSDANTDVT